MKADLCIIKRQAMTISFFHFLANYWARLGLIGYKEEVRMLLFEETVDMLNVEDSQEAVPEQFSIAQPNPFKDIQGDFKTAIKQGFLCWMAWEQGTLRLYQELYRTDKSDLLLELMDKVANQITEINRKCIKLDAIGYDYKHIMDMQPKIRNKVLIKMRA